MNKSEETTSGWCIWNSLLDVAGEGMSVIKEEFVLWEEVLDIFGGFVGSEFCFLYCYYCRRCMCVSYKIL